MRGVTYLLVAMVCFGLGAADPEACGSGSRPRMLTANSGNFSSPNYPSNYPNNANCQWHITQANSQARVRLDFEDFVTESSYDWVNVHDGNSLSAPRILRQSGTARPPSQMSSGPNLFVQFTTDSSVVRRGFLAKYISEPACFESSKPQNFTGSIGETGNFSSPYHPLRYGPNFNCSWVLQGTGNGVVELEFTAFELEEADSAGCRWDYVEIFDGMEEVGRYCGTDAPPKYTSFSQSLTINFVTDQSIQRNGFFAQYQIIADGPRPSTTTTSPGTGVTTTPGGSTPSGGTTGTTPDGSTPEPTPPPFAVPELEISLNGTFNTVSGAEIHPFCLSAYSTELRKSTLKYLDRANVEIGSSICASHGELVITNADTQIIGFQTNGLAFVTLLQRTVPDKSFAIHNACVEELSVHAANHSNWPSPIVSDLPGCEPIVFNPGRFDVQGLEYKCL